MLKYFVFFGLAVIVIPVIWGLRCSEKINGVHDKRFNSNTYRGIQGVSRRQCGKRCIAGGSCKAVNYNARTQTCELIDTADTNSLAYEAGTEYIEKTDLSKEYGDPCADDPCPALQTCIVLSSGVRQCVITECGNYPVIPNAYNTWPRARTPVGWFVKYQCNDGFKFAEGSETLIVCLANGSFDDVYISCEEEVLCPSPPFLANGKEYYTSKTPGSTVTYTCMDGHWMTYGLSFFVITCGQDGEWSALTVQCH